MQIAVTFRHIEPSEALKEFAQEKVTRIDKYIHTPSDAHVVLSKEKLEHRADITLQAHGLTLRGRSTSEDMYASIDGAMRNIEKQVKKYRGKLSSHKSREGKDLRARLNRIAASAELIDPLSSQEAGKILPPKILDSKELAVKTFNLEEAVMQIDLMNAAFLVFKNADTDAINVLYRNEGEGFGLIETT